MQVAEEHLSALLARVQKPARYVGGEWNSVVKDWASEARGGGLPVTLALAYPDVYEIGMSNLGLAILYDLVNRRGGFLAERVYMPWSDMEAAMRAERMPLFSLETRHALADFDVLGFSLQHELTYTNMLAMLDLAGLPVWARERDAAMPLVIAGGSCAYNPEPMADFVDAFVIGEGEQVLLELLEAVRVWKAEAHPPSSRSRLLQRLADIPGVYVPSLYQPGYREDGTLQAIEPLHPHGPGRVRKRIISRLGPVPTRPIVPAMQIIHDRGAVEIQRGCSRGCRFCQAGVIYRPVRERPLAETLEAMDCMLAATGYSEVGLVSLSSSDHSQIAEIVAQAMARHAEEGLAISLPSLRIDSFSVKLAEMIQSTRKTGFTFAPEAGSQRLRNVINKGVSETDLLRTTAAAFSSGWNRLKLYFMLGLPTETDEDVLEIARLIHDIREQGHEMRRRTVNITASIGTFVPKPHTPFQWVPLAEREVVERRQRLLRDRTALRGVALSWSPWEDTWLEAVLCRGDRRLGAVIHRAWRAGARFDAWSEHFHPELWHRAFSDEGLDPDFYVARQRERDEVLPWAMVDVGVTADYLWREYEHALQAALSPDCRRECHACGILASYGGERGDCLWGCPE